MPHRSSCSGRPRLCAWLPLLLAPFGLGPVGAQPEQPHGITVLGWPGAEGHFTFLSDGSVRIGSDGPRILTWVDADRSGDEGEPREAEERTGWVAPGVRAVETTRQAAGVEVTTCTGAE